jgi:hypothetical protein
MSQNSKPKGAFITPRSAVRTGAIAVAVARFEPPLLDHNFGGAGLLGLSHALAPMTFNFRL